MRLLGLCGSLRRASLNRAALQAAARLAPPDIEFVVDERLRKLPLYDYDLDGDVLPDIVAAVRHDVARSDGVIIATPEYAHGISGPMKNALDWLVGDVDFPGKPVALWNTSPRAEHAQAHLRDVLTTMSAQIVEEASLALPLLGADWTLDAIAGAPHLSGAIRDALRHFATAILSRRD